MRGQLQTDKPFFYQKSDTTRKIAKCRHQNRCPFHVRAVWNQHQVPALILSIQYMLGGSFTHTLRGKQTALVSESCSQITIGSEIYKCYL